METNNQKGDTKWNNHQEKHAGELNEGFSAGNIAPDFDPGAQDKRALDRETEIDQDGNIDRVSRARFPDEPQADTEDGGAFSSNQAIEHPKSMQNRDFNYDRDATRYPPDHPENHRDRSNP